MIAFLIKRVVVAVFTLALVALTVFLLIRMVPGDPALIMLGDAADETALAALRARLGLDQPLPVQFLAWVGQALKGDLGRSILTREEVGPLLLDRLGLSATIIGLAMGIAVLIAVPLGIVAAWKQNSRLDLAIVGLSTFGLSLPSFWLGLLLLTLFGISLGWFPVVGYVSFAANASEAWRFLVLPVTTLVIIEVGVLTRMIRSNAIEILRLDYVSYARSKGLSERAVLLHHVLPNALAPTLTLIGLIMGTLLGGIAVVETVFTLPGLGRLLVEAIYGRDYPVVQGCLLIIACGYVLINLTVDLLYPVLDPRVALQ